MNFKFEINDQFMPSVENNTLNSANSIEKNSYSTLIINDDFMGSNNIDPDSVIQTSKTISIVDSKGSDLFKFDPKLGLSIIKGLCNLLDVPVFSGNNVKITVNPTVVKGIKLQLNRKKSMPTTLIPNHRLDTYRVKSNKVKLNHDSSYGNIMATLQTDDTLDYLGDIFTPKENRLGLKKIGFININDPEISRIGYVLDPYWLGIINEVLNNKNYSDDQYKFIEKNIENIRELFPQLTIRNNKAFINKIKFILIRQDLIRSIASNGKLAYPLADSLRKDYNENRVIRREIKNNNPIKHLEGNKKLPSLSLDNPYFKDQITSLNREINQLKRDCIKFSHNSVKLDSLQSRLDIQMTRLNSLGATFKYDMYLKDNHVIVYRDNTYLGVLLTYRSKVSNVTNLANWRYLSLGRSLDNLFTRTLRENINKLEKFYGKAITQYQVIDLFSSMSGSNDRLISLSIRENRIDIYFVNNGVKHTLILTRATSKDQSFNVSTYIEDGYLLSQQINNSNPLLSVEHGKKLRVHCVAIIEQLRDFELGGKIETIAYHPNKNAKKMTKRDLFRSCSNMYSDFSKLEYLDHSSNQWLNYTDETWLKFTTELLTNYHLGKFYDELCLIVSKYNETVDLRRYSPNPLHLLSIISSKYNDLPRISNKATPQVLRLLEQITLIKIRVKGK